MSVPDDVELVLVGAVAARRDPAKVLDTCDVAALVEIAERLERAGDPAAAAAAALVGIVRERPFGRANAAAGWLAAAHVLASAGLEVDLRAHEITSLVRRVQRGGLDEAALVEHLAAHVRPLTGPWRRAARAIAHRLLRPVGPTAPVVRPCPACGLPVALSPTEHRSMVVGGPDAVRYELTARCWYVHRTHRRDGRPLARTASADRRGSRRTASAALVAGRR
ncbi:MAG: hypothetical protein S0880_07105 [Actinomycetota bacterium]|nr:hypothetical protein [Actinomycetota bacterium]